MSQSNKSRVEGDNQQAILKESKKRGRQAVPFSGVCFLGYVLRRWRGLWRVQIQEYLTAAIQKIQALVRYAKGPARMAMTGAIMDMIKTRVSPVIDFFIKVKSGLSFIKNMQQEGATVVV